MRMFSIAAAVALCTLWTLVLQSAVCTDSDDNDSISPLCSRWSVSAELELNSALLGTMVGGDNGYGTGSLATRIGAKKGQFYLFVFAEYGFFGNPAYGDDISNTLLNTGGGASIQYFDKKMSAMLCLGPSILLTKSFQNNPGTTGIFAEIRPAGFHFQLAKISFQIYPITLAWIMPIMQNIPLIYIQYRTAISIGGSF